MTGLFVDLQVDGDMVTLLVNTGLLISILHHSIRDKSPSLKSSPLNKMEFSPVAANIQPLDVMGSIMAKWDDENSQHTTQIPHCS